MTETQVGELLERATAELRPTSDLVAGGIAGGRRRRRRGLALTAAGTFAAAAVVGGAVALSPGNGPASHDTVVADRSGSAGASSYAAEPSTVPHSSMAPVPNDGPFPVAPDAMASTLATLVPGTVTGTKDDQYHLDAADGWQSGAVEVDGGTVLVSIQHSTGPRCDGDLSRGNRDCTALGGGYFTSTYSAEITTASEGRTGVHDIGVTYYTPDGIKINATAANSAFADPTHPSVHEPVLDLGALAAIAENPVWQG
jgi:hypothetical protein